MAEEIKKLNTDEEIPMPPSGSQLVDSIPEVEDVVPEPPKGSEYMYSPGGFTDPQQYVEAAKGIPGGAVQVAGTALKGLASYLPTDKPIQENNVFKAGQAVEEFGQGILPAQPGYADATGREIGGSIGSWLGLMPSILAGPLGAGITFSAAGSGEALNRALAFDKAEKEAGRVGLSEEQLSTAALLGIAPGVTDLAPVEIMMRRLRVPEPLQKPLIQVVGRIGGQAFIEGIQEGGQQFLQNAISTYYNPNQDLTEGVTHSAGIGAATGGIIQTGLEAFLGIKKASAKKGFFEPKEAKALTEEEILSMGAEGDNTVSPDGPVPPPPEGSTPVSQEEFNSIVGPEPEQPAEDTPPPPEGAELVKEEIPQARVFQGSGSTHTKIDDNYIGSGEGSQIFGYGHYFAEEEQVSENYQRQVGYDNLIDRLYLALPQDLLNNTEQVLEEIGATPAEKDFILALRDADWLNMGEPVVAADTAFKNSIPYFTDPEDPLPIPEEIKLKAAELGQLYEIEINMPRENFYMLDQTLKEQSEHVQTALKPMIQRRIKHLEKMLALTEKNIGVYKGGARDAQEQSILDYKALIARFKSGDVYIQNFMPDWKSKDAALILRSYGLPGFRYWDKLSRDPDKYDKTLSYVVFPGQTDKIQILSRKSLPLEEIREGMYDSAPTQSLHNDMPLPGEDPFQVSEIMRPVLRALDRKRQTSVNYQKVLDAIDAQEPRYVINDLDYQHLTSTELEDVLAYMGNQLELPYIGKVVPGSLEASKITADVHDLPVWGDPRILLPEGVDLSAAYMQMQSIAPTDPNRAKQLYSPLLDAGLRVIPSRGFSYLYGGRDFAMEPIDSTNLPLSTRSMQSVALATDSFDLDLIKSGIALKKTLAFKTQLENREAGFTHLAVDLSRLEPGTLVSPSDKMLKDIDQYLELTTKPNLLDAERVEKLVEEGYLNPVTTEDFMGIDDQPIEFWNIKPIPANAFITAYHRPTDIQTLWQRDIRDRLNTAEGGVLLKKLPEDTFKSTKQIKEIRSAANVIAQVVYQTKPILDNLLSRLGAKTRATIVIDENGTKSSNINVNDNIIYLNVQHMMKSGLIAGPLRLRTFNVLMHEYGHAIAYRSYDNLPMYMRERIYAGYQRALLRFKQRGTSFDSNYPLAPSQVYFGRDEYYLKFSEYLAEQFRRFAFSDPLVLDDIDKYFKTASKELVQLYEQVIDHMDAKEFDQLYTSTHSYNMWMNYLELMRDGPETVLQMKMEADNLPSSPPLESRMQEAQAAVKQEMLALRKLFTADTTIRLTEGDQTQLEDGQVGEFNKQSRTLRLMVGVLAQSTDMGGMRDASRHTIAHEAWHGIEDILTPQQRKLLVDQAKREKVFQQVGLYNQWYDKTATAKGITIDPVVKTKWIENEYMAFLAEARVNGKSFNSAVDQLLDTILEFFRKVANLMKGYGFQTADSIINSFYRGEITARYDAMQRQQIPLQPIQLPGGVPEYDRVEWAFREFELYTAVKGMLEKDEGKESFYDQSDRLQEDIERQKNAKALGLPVEAGAPRAVETEIIAPALRKYGGNNPRVSRYLHGIANTSDRVAWYSRIWHTIHQITWMNPHIQPLRNILTLAEKMNTSRMAWVSKADETARAWSNLPNDQADAVSELLFWATEMRYRTPLEVRNGVVRQPTNTELQREVQRLRIGREALQMYVTIRQDFSNFLDECEITFAEQIHKQFATNPQALQNALTELSNDMTQLRRKPYFPLTRFGKYALTGKDPVTGATVWFSAYATKAERDAAVRQVYNRHQGQINLSIAPLPEDVQEFMGLPGPLLKRIKANMPGLSQQQLDWLDRFGHMMAPEQSFKKRWLERKGTPGYSIDGIRVYAQYFRSGANYLSKLQHRDDIQEQITELQRSVTLQPDGEKRQKITTIVEDWFKYVMEPGREWSTLKALTTHWHLGSSIAAAGYNLTQVPMVTYPYLSNLFGEKAALKILQKYGKGSWALTPWHGQQPNSPLWIAREEMIAQGKIETGQAAELGAFAESSNLDKTYGGTIAQKALRKAAWINMLLFQKAESLNREVTFRAAWDLALADPQNRHVRDMQNFRMPEILDLQNKYPSLTLEQATAFFVAREAIDRTQGIYHSWAKPKFMRGKLMGTLSIFMQYPQQLLFQLGNNPGNLKMWMVLAFLYGAAGLPFAEDVDSAIRAAARKIFGKDFSLEDEARKFIRDMTQGTFLDEVGPDLFLHGVSRYSYGLALLGEGYGIPEFDASLNGSMGKLIPGFEPLMRGIADSGAGSQQGAETVGRSFQDFAGAAFGQLFVISQYMMAPPYSEQQKAWEALLPRGYKAMAKAYRYYKDGKETTRQGGTLAQFDMHDPDDRSTVIAQALGFTPRKLTEAYDRNSAYHSRDAFFKAKKLELYVSYDIALKSKDKGAQQQVIDRIKKYNADLKQQGLGSLAITKENLITSLKQRQKTRERQDSLLPQSKKSIPLAQQVDEMYPGFVHERKTVK